MSNDLVAMYMGRYMLDKESTMEGKLDKKSARSKGKQDRRDFFQQGAVSRI